MLTPTIDTSELLASPSAWLNVLAAALTRGDEEAVQNCQARLQSLGWLVLTPADVERLQSEHEAQKPQEPQERQPEPETTPEASEAPEPPTEPEESPS